ncbi:reverse transcriptase [Lithospermum erythrorhizon]|uniref:Reverse transcriptase n=1 Tax=Lithospermum erythrorhizon TaxID=34254 RepID=A0AAV3RX83_LITER
MKRDKAPSPDGFSLEFYKDAWSVVKDFVIRAFQHFFQTGNMPKFINSTTLTLIPKKINLTNVCFVDDLCILSATNVKYISSVKKVLYYFGEIIGLKLNLKKSLVCFVGIEDEDHLNITLGIIKASLPIKYLGIPLNTKQLNSRYCRSLIDKINAKIGCWGARQLSYAERLNLQQSVIFGMYNFWCRKVFLLSFVIKKINDILINFFWHGKSEGKGKTKVSWKDMNSPKKEGGLGLKDVVEWSNACMARHLLNICVDKDTLWIRWINTYRLKGVSVWRVQKRSIDTNTWSKLLNLSPFIRPNV